MTITRSRIGWTDYSGGDANYVLGCTKISDGCKHCYYFELGKQYRRDYSIIEFSMEKLHRLVHTSFNLDHPCTGPNPLVFVCDMSELFHKKVPGDFILQAINMLGDRPDVTWQILTKRIERAAWILSGVKLPVNIWIGVTCENQITIDERLPYLEQVDAAIRFISVEPMLGPVDLPQLVNVDWVICRAESGPHRRAFSQDWASSIWTQCKQRGIPFFYKQGSARLPGMDDQLQGQWIKEFPLVITQQPALF